MRDALMVYGEALADYFRGNKDAVLVSTREDGYVSEAPLWPFFREAEDSPEIERIALGNCCGYVLDVGAGAGRHSLILQERGLEVCAIDIIPQAIEIMRARGVQDARLADVITFDGGPFDTIMMLMHGIGMVETLSDLADYLANVKRLLKPGGQLLVDSLDVRCTDNPEHLAYHNWLQAHGRYYGEVRMQFSYQGQTCPMFGWLHVDPQTFGEYADKQDWYFEILHQEESGDYLAKLTEKD